MNEPLEAYRVLLLDGEARSALAAVRSLGAAGYEVAVASHAPRAIAQRSKYADYVFRCPSPTGNPETYTKWLQLTIEQWQPHVVLPVTDASMHLVLQNEQLFRPLTQVPTITSDTLLEVSDKAHLMEVAASLGLKVPKTYALPDPQLWTYRDSHEVSQFTYPAVLKPRLAICDLGSKLEKCELYYVESDEDVRPILEDVREEFGTSVPYMLQECVQGDGVGVFALCSNGETLFEFCHQRLLEKPPSGGRSVLSEGIARDQAPLREALTLLKHFNWFGVAMVEFKKTGNGEFYLMEINPRLWGSLQLAIDSNRDFPKLLCDFCCTPPESLASLREEVGDYVVGNRLRWLLGNLDHLLIRFKKNPIRAASDVFRGNALQVWTHRKVTRFEVCRLSDIRPFFAELLNYIADLFPR